mgnify:CR=1 FL=1
MTSTNFEPKIVKNNQGQQILQYVQADGTQRNILLTDQYDNVRMPEKADPLTKQKCVELVKNGKVVGKIGITGSDTAAFTYGKDGKVSWAQERKYEQSQDKEGNTSFKKKFNKIYKGKQAQERTKAFRLYGEHVKPLLESKLKGTTSDHVKTKTSANIDGDTSWNRPAWL